MTQHEYGSDWRDASPGEEQALYAEVAAEFDRQNELFTRLSDAGINIPRDARPGL